MSAATLPHPSELTALQALLQVDGYEEFNDTFHCIMHTSAPDEGQPFVIPAMLLPMLINDYGAPDELTGRTFLVESLHERLTRKMVNCGWANTGAGIHHAEIDICLPSWEKAIESCIEVATGV